MKTYLSRVAAKLGLRSADVCKNYLVALLWGALIVMVLSHLGQLRTFAGGLLTAVFFFGLSHVRNTYLEAQLKTALESALNYSTASFEEFQVMIRNRTWVPVTIREIRLRKAPDKRKPGPLVRMHYRGPSYCVVNDDPDEWEGDFLPHSHDLPWPVKAKMGILQPDENYEIRFSPEPGDFHTLAPETGAVYALPFGVCKQFLEDDIHECLIVVDYPTILGRRKVIVIHASKHAVDFVQKSVRNVVPMMESKRRRCSNNTVYGYRPKARQARLRTNRHRERSRRRLRAAVNGPGPTASTQWLAPRKRARTIGWTGPRAGRSQASLLPSIPWPVSPGPLESE